jgi:hypothetical protein
MLMMISKNTWFTERVANENTNSICCSSGADCVLCLLPCRMGNYMISKTEQLAIDQGRKFATAQQYVKILRRRLPDTFQIRNFGMELKANSEAELVLAIICQAWTDNDSQFFLGNSSLEMYCKLLDLDVDMIRKDFERHNKPFFFATHKG